MVTLDEAFAIVMKSVFETKTETISFRDCYGRILDEDIVSDMDMPPFNRSAVDGYACHLADLNNDLEVVEVVAAGREPLKKVGKDQCSKIMTGAIVPDGCDIVFMIEDSRNLPDGKIRFTGEDRKLNVSLKGGDTRKGDVVIRKGKFIRPQEIAIIASVGHSEVQVKKRPIIGIISTGDELVDVAKVPGVAQIRNSNAYQLDAQITRAGGTGIDHGIAPDNEFITYEMIVRAIHQSDVVIITGGVSMGDFDFVPSVLQRAGVNILFDQVNVQPGKPTIFGVHSEAIVFGLPGNPVSSFVQFELLIRPLINRMMGFNWIPTVHKLPLAVNYERKSSARMGQVPVIIDKNMEVMPVDFHGSAHIAALSYSDGIISMNPGIKSLVKGEMVNVRQI